MTDVVLAPTAGVLYQAFTTGGLPLTAGLLYTYEAGSTTPQATYTTSAGNVANPNPIVLGADGRTPAEVWLLATASYRFDLKTSAGTLVQTYDNISNNSGSIYFLQSGSGAVARTAQSKMRDIVSVKDFGALGNGSADDAVAIQAAIDSVASPGGMVYFPAGTYKITTGLTVDNPIVLSGCAGGSIIAPNFGTGDVLTASSIAAETGLTIDGLTFKASVTRTADYYVNLVSSYYTNIRNSYFQSGFHGVGMTGSASTGLRIEACKFADHTGHNINIIAATGTQGSADVLLRDIWINGTSSGSQSTTGVNITSAGDVTLDHVSTIYAGTGLYVRPATGAVAQAVFINDCFFDAGSSHGINIAPTGTGSVALLKAENVWACSSTAGNGVVLAGTGTITQVDLINVTASANFLNGILINAVATNTTIIGGSASANSASGIGIAAGASRFKISGFSAGASGEFAGNTAYGILVNAGASDNYEIVNNICLGNTIDSVSDNGTGQTKVVANNLGHVPSPFGQIGNIPIGAVAYGSLGTAVSHVAGTIYVAEIYIPQAKMITGIAILNAGTVGTSLGIVALYSNDGGAAIATSALAGAASAGANAFQPYAFTAPLTVMNPGRYWIAFQANNNTDNIRCIAASTYINFTKSFAGSFGTIGSLTIPTTTAADVGPIGFVY